MCLNQFSKEDEQMLKMVYILQEVISVLMQLCSVAHFSVIKIRMGAISSAADCAIILILMTEKWVTEQSCIHIEIISCKIPSIV